jgi:pimeloyl-ACP methyl ester carboxylesterase
MKRQRLNVLSWQRKMAVMLVGDFYALPDADNEHPAVLLLHMLGSARIAWNTLIPSLLEAGYGVLTVDLRGDGESGDLWDGQKAQYDTLMWLAWLREQSSVKDDSVSIVGGSMGASLALAGCAADEACVTTIALSPAEGQTILIPVKEAVSEGLAERSAFLIASQRDRSSAETLRTLLTVAKGEINAYLITGSLHGTDIIGSRNDRTRDPVIKPIVDWLNAHLPIAEAE